MPDDRKYRQPGYRSPDAERREPPRPRPSPGAEPRPGPAMPAPKTVSRCGECGTLVPPLSDPAARCPKCGLALHACKQCAHFDPGQRFECREPIPERIADKSARNDCGHFRLRATVERESSSSAVRPDDARRGFDNLFR